LRLLKKTGTRYLLLTLEPQRYSPGAYLLLKDRLSDRGLLLQIIDIEYADLPGLLEDYLREELESELVVEVEDHDPMGILNVLTEVRDASLLVCEARAAIAGDQLDEFVGYAPSRVQSIVQVLEHEQLATLLNPGKVHYPICIGSFWRSSVDTEFVIDAERLDGTVSVITGMKGMGKSHLAKHLVLGLLKYNVPLLVLDVNGEYTRIGYLRDGTPAPWHNRIHVLRPCENYQLSVEAIGLRSFIRLLANALQLPAQSQRVLRIAWQNLEQRGITPTLSALMQEVMRRNGVSYQVREAIYSRLEYLRSTQLFNDQAAQQDPVPDLLAKGNTVILDLHSLSPMLQRVIVEYILSKLADLLEQRALPPLFLVAEEAHLYLRDTHWEEIVTRMRHLGIFTIFVTNQPSRIPDHVYRQLDNLFLFRFVNENDLRFVARASRIDVDTVRYLLPNLPRGVCLVVGVVTRNLPVLVRVSGLEAEAQGETRRFFATPRLSAASALARAAS